jgi:hypothetical protein
MNKIAHSVMILQPGPFRAAFRPEPNLMDRPGSVPFGVLRKVVENRTEPKSSAARTSRGQLHHHIPRADVATGTESTVPGLARV